jgi:hypothetical protein
MRTAQLAPQGWVQFIRSVAQDAKLKVVIGHGVPAATDGKTLWLPALPAQLTPDDLVLFKGNAFHEVGHIRRSDIKFYQAFGHEFGSFASFLLNALDDVFMEGRESQWKAMANRYLHESTLVLIKRGSFRDGSAGLGEAVACFCLFHLTAKRWPDTGIATAQIETNLREHLANHADTVVPALRELIDAEFPKVASTKDGGALALKIIELLKSLAEQEQSQSSPSPKDGDDQDDAEGSTNEADSDPDSKDEDEENAEDGGSDTGNGDDEADETDAAPKGDGKGNESDEELESEQPGKGAANQSQSKPQGDEEDAGSNDDQDAGPGGQDESTSKSTAGQGKQGGDDESQNGSEAKPSAGKSLKEMLDEMLNEELGDQEVCDKGSALNELAASIAKGENEAYKGQPLIDGLVMDFSPNAGKSSSFADGMPVVSEDREMAKVISEMTSRKANVMGNRLRALLANCEETDEYSTRNGRLSEKNLHRVAVNDTRIFAKAEERVEETAAVSITADLSGSTLCVSNGTSVAEQIRIALTLIEKVLNEIGTPREILGFAPETGELNCMVKTFGDSHRVTLDRIAGLHQLAGGDCTPIGSAVMQAGSRLMGHEAQRKLLFVITDGSPDCTKHAVEMTNAVLQNGVDVIYLVIGSAQSCNWLEGAKIKYAFAPNAEGLIPALVSKVAEFLK